MKRIIYSLLAATICLSSCQKEDSTTTLPMASSTSITEADFENSKAIHVSTAKKNKNYGMDLDYDLVIKEVSDDKYKVGLRLSAYIVNTRRVDSKVKASFRTAIFGAVLGLNTTKKESEVPLDMKLTSSGINGDIFEFPEFEYKGDLTYELVNVNTSFLFKDGELKIKDKTTFTMAGSNFTVDGGNFDMSGNSFLIKEGTTVTVNGEKTETNFAILLQGGKGSCSDDDDFFVLPKGNTQEQDPKVAKITFPKNDDGTISKVLITVVGDPAGTVTGAYYTPAPIPDPNNPGSTIQPPVVKFTIDLSTNRKSLVRMYGPATSYVDGQPIFKKSDFDQYGEGWARITLVHAL